MSTDFNLDTVLFKVTDKIEDPLNDTVHTYETDFTIRNAVTGVQIFGGIGSGKTSASGRYIALKYLTNGFGGLVLTAKADECENFQKLCALAGRSEDVIVVSPKGKHRFNFIQYESSGGDGKSETENLVQVLKTVIRANEAQSNKKADDTFWESSLDLLLFNSIDLCKLAFDEVTIERLYDIVNSIPKQDALIDDDHDSLKINPDKEKEKKKVKASAFDLACKKVEEKLSVRKAAWVDSLSDEEYEALHVSETLDDEFIQLDEMARLYDRIMQFFWFNYIPLSSKTRSIVDFIFISFTYKLLRDPIYSTFCTGNSTFTPEDSLNGKIIIIDFPVKHYYAVGKSCQILFKYVWQRAMERRDISVNGRPIFLYADESQFFLHEYDVDYQATARSCRIATVYLTQNIPNYHANMMSDNSEYRVKSFLGTLNTKIFHCNADYDTNKYASQLIGEWKVDKYSQSEGRAGMEKNANVSVEEVFEPRYRPEFFTGLAVGGKINNYFCEAVMHFQGIKLGEGLNSAKMSFNQNFKP